MTADEYFRLVAGVDPTAPKYAPGAYGPGTTACNFFAADVCAAAGAKLPQQLATDQIVWLLASSLWASKDAVDAKRLADSGAMTLVTWMNPEHGGHSHIAVVVPALTVNVEIAQAGRTCFLRGPLAAGFGSRPVRFFVWK